MAALATEKSVGLFPQLSATFGYPTVIPAYQLEDVARILRGFDVLAQWAYRGVEDLPITTPLYKDDEGKYYSIPTDDRGIILVRRVHCESPLEVIIQIGGIAGGGSAAFYVVADSTYSRLVAPPGQFT